MVQLSNDGSAVRAERSRRRAEAQRLNILRAAARVFRQRGFAGAGMREIAREADLSPGNLYHYFRGKHEILFFCQDRWLEHMLAVLERAVEGAEVGRATGGHAPVQAERREPVPFPGRHRRVSLVEPARHPGAQHVVEDHVRQLMPQHLARVRLVGTNDDGAEPGQRGTGAPWRQAAAGEPLPFALVAGHDEAEPPRLAQAESGVFGRPVGLLGQRNRQVEA